MKYTEEMILQSPSGYCMPFEEEQNKEITLSKGYGEQKDAVTGETSFHHGIDFHASHRPLASVACRVSVRTKGMAYILSYATVSMK